MLIKPYPIPVLLCCTLAPSAAWSAEVEVEVLTDEIIIVHFDDGHVDYHTNGEPQSADVAVIDPVDAIAASAPGSYAISSRDDAAFSRPVAPIAVDRKTKPTEMTGDCDSYAAGTGCTNRQPDAALEHWFYLHLPAPLQSGSTYTVALSGIPGFAPQSVTFDPSTGRSEAVHVNLVGYTPASPAKYGYVYHWMGDGGSLDASAYEGAPCRLRRNDDNTVAYDTALAFRAAGETVETIHTHQTPGGSYTAADVYECDFSGFSEPGEYFLEVEGVGRSFPFRIDQDVYREVLHTVMKGIFHQRSGIEITEGHGGGFSRPADHNPTLTPGFAPRLVYTSTRLFDAGEGTDYLDAWEAGIQGNIDVWGWYHDAGDWDAYSTHAAVPALLLMLVELSPPDRFTDGELELPESGNGLPDVLDEAMWLPRFYYRCRHAALEAGYSTGGVCGARVMGDLWGEDRPDGIARGSWQDNDRQWIVSGESPHMTYRYAALAAQIAWILEQRGYVDPDGVDWRGEAIEAWSWAQDHTLPGDDEARFDYYLPEERMWAAAALYRLTGEDLYHESYAADVAAAPFEELNDRSRYAAILYAGLSEADNPDPRLQADARAALDQYARLTTDDGSIDRPLRWRGRVDFPAVIGHLTTPRLVEAAAARLLAVDYDPQLVEHVTPHLYTTADYFLGTNPLNMTWVTGLGERSPQQVFRLDAWADEYEEMTPGVIPYGPTALEFDINAEGPEVGWWMFRWAYRDGLIHPSDPEQWPLAERWHDARYAPMAYEYTVHQNQAVAAIVYGALLGEAGPTVDPDPGDTTDTGDQSPGADQTGTTSGSAETGGPASGPTGGSGGSGGESSPLGDGGAGGGCGCQASAPRSTLGSLAWVVWAALRRRRRGRRLLRRA